MTHVLQTLITDSSDNKVDVLIDILTKLRSQGYNVAEINVDKPWGLYIRLQSSDADKFIAEFFPTISPSEARLGNGELELSPKILLASPGHRLSWQYHHRRAECWRFLTNGSYIQSDTDQETEVVEAAQDDLVQFTTGQRHRLIAPHDAYAVVAEIWQHTDPEHPSDEDDIIRLQDDYSR